MTNADAGRHECLLRRRQRRQARRKRPRHIAARACTHWQVAPQGARKLSDFGQALGYWVILKVYPGVLFFYPEWTKVVTPRDVRARSLVALARNRKD
jgi:hypothetical protein